MGTVGVELPRLVSLLYLYTPWRTVRGSVRGRLTPGHPAVGVARTLKHNRTFRPAVLQCVGIPEPQDQDAKWAKRAALIHYGSAIMCVVGLGFGFAQPESTRSSMKGFYFTSAITLVASMASLLATEKPGCEDLHDPKTYWIRVVFMLSDYATFLSGGVAIAYPRLTSKLY